MKLVIAFLQLLPGKILEEQLEIGKRACIEARHRGADIALFPEMWSDGYYLPQDENELNQLAIRKDSDFIQTFRELAAELRMAIGITFLEQNELLVQNLIPHMRTGTLVRAAPHKAPVPVCSVPDKYKTDSKPLNSIILFDRNGKEVLHYSKVHTCAFDLEKVLAAGNDFYTADLDFGRGTVKVGAMICFDREFPESARILMLKGAELILAPNACPMEINRLSALRTRAYENMLAVATCNYPKGHPDCNGRSTLFDGVPWLPDEPGVRDMCVFEAPEEEGIYLAELDLEQLRNHRSDDVMGDKYRHPAVYDSLISQNC